MVLAPSCHCRPISCLQGFINEISAILIVCKGATVCSIYNSKIQPWF